MLNIRGNNKNLPGSDDGRRGQFLRIPLRVNGLQSSINVLRKEIYQPNKVTIKLTDITSLEIMNFINIVYSSFLSPKLIYSY